MYMRKFEADSLEEALRNIKRELGPDAIILKTVTNKGIKGAFKKNRIEITAAISEKNYTKKARVDYSMDKGTQEKFYENNSEYISSVIDNHSDNRKKSSVNSHYGNAGLNKSVKRLSHKVKDSLDDFLSGGVENLPTSSETQYQREVGPHFRNNKKEEALAQVPEQVFLKEGNFVNQSLGQDLEKALESSEDKRKDDLSYREMDRQRKKIDELEKQLYELTKNMQRIENPGPVGIYQLRTTLRSLDINEQAINDIVKKALFELSQEDTHDVDIVFEFALREMLQRIHVEMPKFSSLEGEKAPFVTVLLSENSCGQSSMLYKLGALKKNSVLIKYQGEKERGFTEKVFGLDVIKVSTIPEIISQIRKNNELGKSLFVDYRNYKTEVNDTKNFIDGLRRSFEKVEVMVCLSAIHSEAYNRKIMTMYQNICDGLVMTHLDQCLNYGAIFNICEEYPRIPFHFFGTGDTIPSDIEVATAERILAGMFKLS